MEFIREDCIYARQSVDRKDSISIESQIDFCKYELKGGSCRVFKDKGYSGKNTDRPEFQKLLGEIRKGKVRRVIVYKLDRISRSILDFATMMEAVCRVYVLVPGQFHTGGCLVDQRPDFCGNLNHTVSSSFTL